MVTEDVPHEFGGEHTQEKLQALRDYLPAYTTALGRRFTLYYIDAFAGTGECDITVAGTKLRVPGSASIAIDCKPPFHKMVFIEKAASRIRALEKLSRAAKDRDIAVVRDDANAAVPAHLAALRRSDRAVILLDPYGMTVDWTTLAKIAASKLADVWYLFPLSGLYRQAAKDSRSIDAFKEASLTRIMGPHDWKKALYEPKPTGDLFGDNTDTHRGSPAYGSMGERVLAEHLPGRARAQDPLPDEEGWQARAAALCPLLPRVQSKSGRFGPRNEVREGRA
jgi:three-Cys-motif partner protein